MSNLANQQINSTFSGLLQIPGGIKSYLQTVQDGDGNPTALQISTTGTNIIDSPDIITPEQFGAVGNGIADDTASMQDALDYMPNGILQLKSGATYLCGNLTVSNSTSINGSNSTIKAKTGTTTLILYNAGSSNFFVNGVTLDGNNISDDLLDIVTGTYCVIQNNKFINYVKWGLGLQSCQYTVVNNNYIKRATSTPSPLNLGIWVGTNITNFQYNTIANNTLVNGAILSSATDGNDIYKCKYINNVITGWQYSCGVAIGADFGAGSTATFIEISGNYCQSGTGIDADGFTLKGIECFSSYTKIVNNTLFGNSGPGIFSNGYNVVVANNLCLNNGTYGEPNVAGIVLGATAQDQIVTGNKCSDTNGASGTQQYGIAVNPVATQIAICANQFNNNKIGNTYIPGYANAVSFFGRQFYGQTTWNVPSIAAGLSSTTTVTVAGALLGNIANVSCSISLAGLSASAYVSASNQITIVLANNTAGAIVLGPATFYVSASETIFS